MQKHRVCVAFLAGLFPVAVLASPVAATVNGVPISTQEIQQVLRLNPQLARLPHIRRHVLDGLIDTELLAQYAIHHHLEDSPAFRTRLTIARRQILADSAVQHYIRSHPISATALQRAYNHFVAALGTRRYRVRQILVRHKSQAERLLHSLKNGASFSVLAKEYSLAKSTAGEGGELGWIIPDMLIPPLAHAVQTAKLHHPVGPIRTQYGYQILDVQGVRKITPPPMRAIAPRLRVQLEQQEAARWAAQLRAHDKVVMRR